MTRHTIVCEICATRTVLGYELAIGMQVLIPCAGCGESISATVADKPETTAPPIVFANIMHGRWNVRR